MASSYMSGHVAVVQYLVETAKADVAATDVSGACCGEIGGGLCEWLLLWLCW